MTRARGLLLAGVLVVILVPLTLVLFLRASEAESGTAPPEATAATVALLSGDPGEVREALSPLLAESLAPDRPPALAEPIPVELVDWGAQGPFAAATALVGPPGEQVAMDVGFRLVDDQWRITFAQVQP